MEEKSKPIVRIVSGSPQAVEDAVNELLVEYAPFMWNVGLIHDGVRVTCGLILERELRRQQFAAMQAAGVGRPPGLKL